MCHKVYSLIVVIVAIILALLAVVLPQGPQAYLSAIMKFFEVMIPVLAVGALIKYLCCCPSKN